MQYVFFEKGIRSIERDLGQSARSWGIFENFCVKVILNCNTKILGAGCTSCSPLILLGEHLLPWMLPLLPQFLCP